MLFSFLSAFIDDAEKSWTWIIAIVIPFVIVNGNLGATSNALCWRSHQIEKDCGK